MTGPLSIRRIRLAACAAGKHLATAQNNEAHGHVSDSICPALHDTEVSWSVLFHPAFDGEFKGLSEAVQDELLAHAQLLEEFGPTLGRPRVDTLKGSRHANMKELRFDADSGAWRVAFASTRVVGQSCWL